MGINQNNQRHVVWQDVKRVKPVPLEPIKKPKRIRFKKPDFKKIYKFFNKNNLKQIKNKFCSLPKKMKIVICILIIFVLALSAFIIKTQLIDRMTSSGGYSVENLAAKTPQFKAFLPKDKTIDDLGGWHKLTPPNSGPVFVYLDQIDNVQIRVTQQTLPEDFADDKNAQIEQLAKGFKADEKITVGDTIVYVGTNISGAQSVIFEKNNILILITSTSKIDSKSWASYIDTLQ